MLETKPIAQVQEKSTTNDTLAFLDAAIDASDAERDRRKRAEEEAALRQKYKKDMRRYMMEPKIPKFAILCPICRDPSCTAFHWR